MSHQSYYSIFKLFFQISIEIFTQFYPNFISYFVNNFFTYSRRLYATNFKIVLKTKSIEETMEKKNKNKKKTVNINTNNIHREKTDCLCLYYVTNDDIVFCSVLDCLLLYFFFFF